MTRHNTPNSGAGGTTRGTVHWVFFFATVGLLYCNLAWVTYPVLRYVGYLSASVMVFSALAGLRSGAGSAARACGLWIVFVGWILVTGMGVSVNIELFWITFEQLLQVTFFVLVGTAAGVAFRSPTTHVLAGTVFAMLLAVLGYIRADFTLMEQTAGQRESSLIRNPNALGVVCVQGLAGLTLFWRNRTAAWQRLIIVMGGSALLWALIASGSRKAVACLMGLVVSWMLLVYGRRVLKDFKAAAGIAVVAICAVYVSMYISERTLVGKRIGLTLTGERGSGIERYYFVEEGVAMLRESPVWGVGLGQYRMHSSLGMVSHNDPTEVFANTGIVGGLIYYSMLALLTRQLWRVRRTSMAGDDHYMASCGLCFVVVYLVAGLGAPMHLSMQAWATLSGYVGYAYAHHAMPGRRKVSAARSDSWVGFSRRGPMIQAGSAGRVGRSPARPS
jgi:hypothetical protein